MKKSLTFILVMFSTQVLASLKVSPMMIDLSKNKSAEVTLTNKGNFSISASIQVTDGRNERTAGYVVYPPIINDIKPDEKRLVRVIRKTPIIKENTFVDVSTLNDNYKIKYKLLITGE